MTENSFLQIIAIDSVDSTEFNSENSIEQVTNKLPPQTKVIYMTPE